MDKRLFAVPLAVLLMTTAIAAVFQISLRGNGGTVDFVGEDEFAWAKVHFTSYSRESQGQGGLSVIGSTDDGRRVLNLRFRQTSMEDSEDELEAQGTFRGTYWKQGIGTQSVSGTLMYVYDKETGMTSVEGISGFGLHIVDIPTVEL